MKIAVFASGNGSNCEQIIRHFQKSEKIKVAVVVSNRSDAKVLARASSLGVPTEIVQREQLHDAGYMLPLLKKYRIGFIVLAGFLPLIPEYLTDAFEKRIINLHPSLLPKYGGKGMYGRHVHEAVKMAGDTETGITVHYVSTICDGGEIIRQVSVPVQPTDTVDDIAAKVHGLEMEYFPQIVEEVLAGFL